MAGSPDFGSNNKYSQFSFAFIINLLTPYAIGNILLFKKALYLLNSMFQVLFHYHIMNLFQLFPYGTLFLYHLIVLLSLGLCQ